MGESSIGEITLIKSMGMTTGYVHRSTGPQVHRSTGTRLTNCTVTSVSVVNNLQAVREYAGED